MFPLIPFISAVAVTIYPVNVEANKQYAREFMAQNYNWQDDEFNCLDILWSAESGWNQNARNKTSGAYGIPQALPGSKMASAGSDWRSNAQTQIRWGLSYISGRYGTACGAYNHFKQKHWY